MRTRLLAPLVLLLASTPPARGAVVVIGNYTTESVPFTIAEPKEKARKHTIAANHVAPVYVTGPADITFSANGRDVSHRLDVYNAYVLLPDKAAGVRLEGIELPGKPFELDDRPELIPVRRDPPVKVPVTLLVDDADPRAEKLWQKELRARFDEVAAVIEKTSGIRLEVAGYGTWESSRVAVNMTELLTGFEKAVKVKPGTLAIGYTSRAIDEKEDPSFGLARGLGERHILIREWRPKSESERVEVMLQLVAKALGAVSSPDPGSAMRAKLADGYLLNKGSVLRLDPLNALALNLWADERRRDGAVELSTLSRANNIRLARIYKALLAASPGDIQAGDYLGVLERDIAKQPEPKQPAPKPTTPDPPSTKLSKRDVLVKRIVKAVADRAKANAGEGAAALTGDELTAAYVRAAAEVATSGSEPEMVSAFLIGIGIAIDDTDTLLNDPTSAAAVKGIETPDERKARVAVLGNPTLAKRRDLCRRFFVGCAMGELLPQHGAESVAVGRAVADLNTPGGLCFPTLAAEFAGINFARLATANAEVLRAVKTKFTASDYMPSIDGLRNGFSAAKFAELYRDATDDRFAAVLEDIRKRVKAIPGYKVRD